MKKQADLKAAETAADSKAKPNRPASGHEDSALLAVDLWSMVALAAGDDFYDTAVSLPVSPPSVPIAYYDDACDDHFPDAEPGWDIIPGQLPLPATFSSHGVPGHNRFSPLDDAHSESDPVPPPVHYSQNRTNSLGSQAPWPSPVPHRRHLGSVRRRTLRVPPGSTPN